MKKYIKRDNVVIMQTEYFHPMLKSPKIVESVWTIEQVNKRIAELHKEEKEAKSAMWNNDNDQNDDAFYALDAISEELLDMENILNIF